MQGRKLEYLIQWLGYFSAHDEWLKEEDLGNTQAKLRATSEQMGYPDHPWDPASGFLYAVLLPGCTLVLLFVA